MGEPSVVSSSGSPLQALAMAKQARANADSMAAVRAFLTKFDGYRGELKPDDVRNLIEGMIEAIRPVTQIVIEKSDDLVVKSDCGALWMLSDLVDALGDLKNGRRNPCFEPVNVGGSNMQLIKDRKLSIALVEMVDSDPRSRQRGKRSQVERDLAKQLATATGEPWTGDDLRGLRARVKARERKSE